MSRFNAENTLGVYSIHTNEKWLESAYSIFGAIRAGSLLTFFPEGAFTRMSGLLPFRMGAFVAVAEAVANRIIDS